MNSQKACALAEALSETLGAQPWRRGDEWVVRILRDNGSVLIICDQAVCEYPNQSAFEEGESAEYAIEWEMK